MSKNVDEAIRRDYERGLTYREIAKKHRVSFSTISKVVKNSPKTLAEKVEELERMLEDVRKEVRWVEYTLATYGKMVCLKCCSDLEAVGYDENGFILECQGCGRKVSWNPDGEELLFQKLGYRSPPEE